MRRDILGAETLVANRSITEKLPTQTLKKFREDVRQKVSELMEDVCNTENHLIINYLDEASFMVEQILEQRNL